MAAKKRSWIKEKIYGFLKKSEFLCQVYEFKPQFKMLCRYGAIYPRTYIINHDKKLIYIRMCKVANSSLIASVCEQDLGIVEDYHQLHARVLGTKKLDEDEKTYFKFCFVRNPYDRLVSGYVNKYITEKKEMGVTRTSLYMDHYLLGYIKSPKDFTDFVKKICKIPTCLEDQHFQKQYNLLYDKRGKCRVNYIGKYENLKEDYEKIRKKFDLCPIPHLNQTSKGNWMDYYTLETAELVHKKYKKDFKVFGYEHCYQELIQYLKEKERANV